MLNYANVISRNVKNVYTHNVRSLISFRGIKKMISIYFHRPTKGSKPPYDYICQVGDPVLRKKAALVDTKIIQTKEFQKLLDNMYKLMKKSNVVGLAAPQIGLSWQLFAIEVTQNEIDRIHPWVRHLYNVEPHPLMYFINPKLEILNSEEIIGYETCGSLVCCEAEVARATEVQIHALNRFGEPFSWKGSGWLSRIVQHEMDHLKGILYIDRMFPLTFDYCPSKTLNKTDNKDAIN